MPEACGSELSLAGMMRTMAGRSSRQLVWRIVVFTLAGAALNIAVAWVVNNQPRDFSRAISIALSEAESTRIAKSYVDSPWTDRCRDGEINRWLGLDWVTIDGKNDATWKEFWLLNLSKAGLPMRSLAGGFTADAQGFQLVGSFGIREYQFIYLPLWPGFAVNTALYAAMAYLAVSLPARIRRKRRIARGLCPACAYPIGTNAVCTECGKPVPTRSTITKIAKKPASLNSRSSS